MSNQMRRLMRRMGAGGNQQTRGGLYLPQGAYSPEDEQDRRRDALAERLLEIGLEENSITSFTDTYRVEKSGEGEKSYDDHVAALTLTEWYVKHAEAALAAAEVIYPEPVVEIDEETGRRWGLIPPAAQEGVRTVANLADDEPARGEG